MLVCTYSIHTRKPHSSEIKNSFYFLWVDCWSNIYLTNLTERRIWPTKGHKAGWESQICRQGKLTSHATQQHNACFTVAKPPCRVSRRRQAAKTSAWWQTGKGSPAEVKACLGTDQGLWIQAIAEASWCSASQCCSASQKCWGKTCWAGPTISFSSTFCTIHTLPVRFLEVLLISCFYWNPCLL